MIRSARLVVPWLLFAGLASPNVRAQSGERSAVDELVEMMSSSEHSVSAHKVVELPTHLRGPLVAIAEFDEERGTWEPMAGPQEFGMATVDRLTVLGHEVGSDGFVEAHHGEFSGRAVNSYTGVTPDRRMSINIYDDKQDTEHLILSVRVGPRQLKYLLLRPHADSPNGPERCDHGAASPKS